MFYITIIIVSKPQLSRTGMNYAIGNVEKYPTIDYIVVSGHTQSVLAYICLIVSEFFR